MNIGYFVVSEWLVSSLEQWYYGDEIQRWCFRAL